MGVRIVPGRVTLWSALVLASALVVSPAQPSAAVTGFTVVSVVYSPNPVTVSGLATVPLTVTVRITDTPALPTDSGYLSFLLKRTVGTLPNSQLAGDASLISGDGSDGVWRATIQVPASANGTWTLTNILESGMPGTDHPITGAGDLVVNGTHRPVVTAGTSPALVSYSTGGYVVKGRLVDSETGAGLAGVRVNFGLDNQCAEPVGWTATTLTNVDGYYGFPTQTSIAAKTSLNCVVVQSAGTTVVAKGFFLHLQGWVSHGAIASPVPLGANVRIDGSMSAAYCPIVLQRLTGSTAWRTNDVRKARGSGRFTVYAHPSAGSNIFRLLQPACYEWAPASTKPFQMIAR